MTRLHYWIQAQTQYNIHSPFVFDLYREVLFARLPGEGRSVSSKALLYKLSKHFSNAECEMPNAECMENCCVVARVLIPADEENHQPQMTVTIVDRPHRNAETEAAFAQLCETHASDVVIDMFDSALIICNPHLHPQYFLLK